MKDTEQKWFKDASYGLFIHWGLYSILAGEYNGQKTKSVAEWILNDLDIPLDSYKKLADEFNPVGFNAEEYVKLAKNWGMRYITLTAKHHDGFALFDSLVCNFNVVNATPFGTDIVGEFAKACQKHNMPFCLYYSQAQDWHHQDGYWADSDSGKKDNSGKTFRTYLDEKCIPQVKELLTNYGDIAMLWFDTPLIMTKDESLELYRLVKSIQPNCIINGRIGNDIGDYITTTDNKIPAFPLESDWEVPVTLNDTWGYNKCDTNWKNPEKLIKLLLKINSRGGSFLLNVGPKADGTIPSESVAILNQVAKYINANAEAIYNTKPTETYVYDLENILFTSRDYHLYLHPLSEEKTVFLNNLANKIEDVYLIRDGSKVEYQTGTGNEGERYVKIFFPDNSFCPDTGQVVCIKLKEKDPIYEPLE